MPAFSPLSPSQLRLARRRLLESGEQALGDSIDERLARSWQRSLSAGLTPLERQCRDEYLSASELQRRLARNHDLLSHSRPVMEYLFEQVRDSGSMVILADRDGVLMESLGDGGFVARAERVALLPGANWHEARRGTNAIGTALAEGGGIEIHGEEHFLERNAFLTCAAAAIAGASGELLGVLDISSDQRGRHPHTLGLVNTAARMIENRIVLASCKKQIRLHLHTRAEGIGSVAEGIVALSDDGWIVGANRAGLALLGLGVADIGATPLQRLLDLRLHAILDRARRRPGEAVHLRRHDGMALFALVHAEAPPLTHAPVQAASASPPMPRDALARLDTGDRGWQLAAEKARRIAGKGIALLLHGESGVGKELFARAVHEASPQRQGPFVAINCAALPENLIEAELFGYVPGAFTGARKEGSIGRLREAHGGTLFLDEIGDMPLSMQTRLLRVLQEKEVMPLGGGKAVAVDFALISATHCQLRQAADAGRFRSDLYYRLNGLTLNLPALRERSDLSALVERLLRTSLPEDTDAARELCLSPSVLAAFSTYAWPGNLRQLASALRTAVAMLLPGETEIDWLHLPDDLVEELRAEAGGGRPASSVGDAAACLQEISRRAIDDALAACRGNVSAAARRLGISRQTLYRKLAV